jgi:radical SAM superfamily enzyme YgiQ (UPF0313 family)
MRRTKHRLLLLNPPAPQPVFRDCYCSGISKGSFFIHPLDLQVQSGFFPEADFQLAFIDAVFERLEPPEVLKRIRLFEPDSVLALVGHAFFDSDAAFLSRVKTILPSVKLYLSGDSARFTPHRVFEKLPETDGLLMDFGTPGLLDHLKGVDSPHVITKDSGQARRDSNTARFRYPLPREAVINRYAYRLPFFKAPRYHSMATSFGCPFGCLYCNTHLLGYRTRPVDEVVGELYFAAGHGYKSLYVRDATFLFDRQRTLKLLRQWEQTGLQFEWICFTRPDLIDDEIAEFAASLGCRMMMVGVESYAEPCLDALARNIRSGDTIKAFKILRKFGIRSAAQIIVGLQNSNPPAKENRGDYPGKLEGFLKAIGPDYVSLNVYQTRPGLPADNRILNQLVSATERNMELADRLNKHFYFRPGKFFKQLATIRSLSQLTLQAKIAAGLFTYRS